MLIKFLDGEIAGENDRLVDNLATRFAKISRRLPEVRTAQDSLDKLSDHLDSIDTKVIPVEGLFITLTHNGGAIATPFRQRHLPPIPRRDDDTPNPRCGVRGVIPEKMDYGD